QCARDHLEEGRLAGAVLAHDGPALPAAHGEREVLVDDAVAVALRDAGELDDVVAGAGRRAKLEVLLLDPARLGDLLDLLELLDPALDLRGLRNVRLEPLDEPALLGEPGLLARVLGLAALRLDLAHLLVEVVVAGVRPDLATVDLDDLADDAVHDVA